MTPSTRLLWLSFAFYFALFQLSFPCLAKNLETFDPKKLSVAVIPYAEKPANKGLIDQTAQRIRGELKKIPYFEVVDPKRVEAIVTYYAHSIRKGTGVTAEEKSLAMARTHWFSKHYLEAEADVDRTIASLRRSKTRGDLLVDALLTKAMILKETDRPQEAREVFREALAINPHLNLEDTALSGNTRGVFRIAKKEMLLGRTGKLDIKTDPPMASVFLNGVHHGLTPLVLENLPEGNYLLTVEANNYYPIHEATYVSANATQFMDHKLHWIAGSAKKKVDPSRLAQSAVTEGEKLGLAIGMGRALKVDKVLFVSATGQGGKEVVRVTTVDTSLKAAYNPLDVSLSELQTNREKTLTKLARAVDDQARRNVLDDPSQYLNGRFGDIRTLRHERPFWKKPFFYSLTGALVGGAIGATVGVLVSGGDDDDDGGETGGIEIGFE